MQSQEMRSEHQSPPVSCLLNSQRPNSETGKTLLSNNTPQLPKEIMSQAPVTMTCDQLTELLRPMMQQSVQASGCLLLGWLHWCNCTLLLTLSMPLQQACQEQQAGTSHSEADLTVRHGICPCRHPFMLAPCTTKGLSRVGNQYSMTSGDPT
jgi:hypothetical protein